MFLNAIIVQKGWKALLRTYGRLFAEFLKEDSFVPLRLLASSTSVGLRYDIYIVMLRSFSWKALQLNWPGLNQTFCRNPNLANKGCAPDFPGTRFLRQAISNH